MKRCIFLFLVSITFSLDLWSGEINALKVIQDIKNLGNELKLEEAEKYYQDLVISGEDWCVSKGQCRNQERIKKSVEKTLNEVRLCVPVAKICVSENLDKKSAEECIREMKKMCHPTKPNETGHPNTMAKIIASAEERLPSLKHSSTNTPTHLADAYNKCQEETYWGYSISAKKKESIIKITSLNPRVTFNPNKDWVTVGEFKTESDCFEAMTLAKTKKEIDSVASGCRKRFSGKDVIVSVFEAKAMVKLSNDESLSAQDVTFSTLEKCNENISRKRKYKFPIREYVFDEVEVGAYKSGDPMRFISECKEVKKVVCKNDDNAGFSPVEYFD